MSIHNRDGCNNKEDVSIPACYASQSDGSCNLYDCDTRRVGLIYCTDTDRHTDTRIIYIYTYIYVCVCVCVCVWASDMEWSKGQRNDYALRNMMHRLNTTIYPACFKYAVKNGLPKSAWLLRRRTFRPPLSSMLYASQSRMACPLHMTATQDV